MLLRLFLFLALGSIILASFFRLAFHTQMTRALRKATRSMFKLIRDETDKGTRAYPYRYDLKGLPSRTLTTPYCSPRLLPTSVQGFTVALSSTSWKANIQVTSGSARPAAYFLPVKDITSQAAPITKVLKSTN